MLQIRPHIFETNSSSSDYYRDEEQDVPYGTTSGNVKFYVSFDVDRTKNNDDEIDQFLDQVAIEDSGADIFTELDDNIIISNYRSELKYIERDEDDIIVVINIGLKARRYDDEICFNEDEIIDSRESAINNAAENIRKNIERSSFKTIPTKVYISWDDFDEDELYENFVYD